jgi:glycosyltransferase involved in cell wall biosynthesis
MTRVLFTHRYSMAQVRDFCRAGEYPRQHLWGADALERGGFDVRYGAFGRRRASLQHLSWRLGDRLGDVEQELALAARAGRDAVIYAGEATLVRGLAALRRIGWPVPLVAVVHSATPGVAGLDVAICLSSRIRRDLVERFGRDPALTPVLGWGPDLDFLRYRPTGDGPVVSAGRTDRDVETLLRALADVGVPARVYVGDRRPPAAPPGVEVIAGPQRHLPEALEDVRRASIVAIPLRRTDRLLGLSEINDALALGKPIVMTRTDAIDFDPERVGCGITVAPGDVGGWREALARLSADSRLRAETGLRGRRYAERGYNARAFGDGIVTAVRTALERAGRRVMAYG